MLVNIDLEKWWRPTQQVLTRRRAPEDEHAGRLPRPPPPWLLRLVARRWRSAMSLVRAATLPPLRQRNRVQPPPRSRLGEDPPARRRVAQQGLPPAGRSGRPEQRASALGRARGQRQQAPVPSAPR